MDEIPFVPWAEFCTDGTPHVYNRQRLSSWKYVCVVCGHFDTEHPQTTLIHPRTGASVEVDKGIVRLIQALWARGWDTKFSCQGQPDLDTAYVMFDTAKHRKEFIEAVGKKFKLHPYSRSATTLPYGKLDAIAEHLE